MSAFDTQFCSADDPAFDEFFADIAAVTGVRREQNTSRALSLTVACSVREGAAESAATGALAPTYARLFTVLIRRADWPEVLPPQNGDALTVDTFPDMAVKQVIQSGAELWTLTCISTERSP